MSSRFVVLLLLKRVAVLGGKKAVVRNVPLFTPLCEMIHVLAETSLRIF